MNGARSRRKGASFERDLVRLFRKVMPGAKVQRGLQARGGDEAPDVDCPWFWIEAKRGKRPSVRNALKQAQGTAPKGRVPIAIIRDDRQPAFVAISLHDFLDHVRELWATQRGGRVPFHEEFRAFKARVAERLKQGEREYGSSADTRPPEEMVGELDEELLDIAGWAFLIWRRIRKLEKEV